MVKYVGRHRRRRQWTPQKIILLALVTVIPPAPPGLVVSHSEITPVISIVTEPRAIPAPKPHPIEEPEDPIPEEIPRDDSEIAELVLPPDPPCWFGPGSNLGLTWDADFAYRVICNNFPGVYSYGGFRPGDQDHGTGNAVDNMCDPWTGDALAQFLINNADWLNVKYVIWQQRIWQNGVWSAMEDRGSPTQNHQDHVHLSVW